jgi:23S rRNA maturation-related 3'-5' exoribonuclease YhaM
MTKAFTPTEQLELNEIQEQLNQVIKSIRKKKWGGYVRIIKNESKEYFELFDDVTLELRGSLQKGTI